MLRIGVIVNPIAGLGGPAALKGSDTPQIQARARARGAMPRAGERAREALQPLVARARDLQFLTWGGAMGEHTLAGLGFAASVLGQPESPSSDRDTRRAAEALVAAGIDLMLFAGGDGTARDLAAVLPPRLPVIGIPAGVKMHSGVFAITPRDAGELILRLLRGGLVAAEVAEVRDIDERALREGRVATRYHGEMWVPRVGDYLQHVKVAGREVEALVLEEIAQEIRERLADHHSAVMLGPGSTLLAIKSRLGIQGTLLGFDVVRDGHLLAADADATTLARWITPDSIVVLSFTRGQGFLLGRGNQQLAPALIRRMPRSNIWIVGSRGKLATLEGRPLRVDSGDAGVDAQLAGIVEIISGYEDSLLYQIAAPAPVSSSAS